VGRELSNGERDRESEREGERENIVVKGLQHGQ